MSAGLLDTSVLIDWDDPDVAQSLPDESAVSAVTLAELAAGPHLAGSRAESASRQARLQQVESAFAALPFDSAAARCYGEIVAAVSAAGRSHRRRFADLLIAATARSHQLDLYTRNPADFQGLDELVSVVTV